MKKGLNIDFKYSKQQKGFKCMREIENWVDETTGDIWITEEKEKVYKEELQEKKELF